MLRCAAESSSWLSVSDGVHDVECERRGRRTLMKAEGVAPLRWIVCTVRVAVVVDKGVVSWLCSCQGVVYAAKLQVGHEERGCSGLEQLRLLQILSDDHVSHTGQDTSCRGRVRDRCTPSIKFSWRW